MARRLVAVALLLVVAAVVRPSLAVEDLAGSSSGNETATTTTDSSGGSSSSGNETTTTTTTDDSSSGGDLGSGSSDSSSSSSNKVKERQVAKEKAVAEEKANQQLMLKTAKEKHLVSPTNGTGSYKGMARDFLDYHNKLRARYGLPPLRWDKALAKLARRWSNAMRKVCEIKHSGDEGQSVFVSHDDWNATAKDAVEWWAREEAMYDKDTEECKGGQDYKTCGHFGLIVKKNTAKVGCGRAECFQAGVFITCNYAFSDAKDKKKKQQPNSKQQAADKEEEKEKEKADNEKDKEKAEKEKEKVEKDKKKEAKEKESSN